MEKAKVPVKGSQLGYLPKNKKPVSGRDAEVAINLAEMLDDHDDVQNVYTNANLTEEMMA